MLPAVADILDLTKQHLAGKKFQHWPEVKLDVLRDAFYAAGVGPDYMSGERPLVLMNDSIKREVFLGGALTDRRLIGKLGDGNMVSLRQWNVPFAQVSWAEHQKKLLTSKLVLTQYDQTQVDFPFANYAEELTQFFYDMLHIAPDQRHLGEQPLVQPSPADPVGVDYATQTLWSSDPRYARLLQLIGTAVTRGWYDTGVGISLTTRVALAARNSVLRGMRDGWWLSPLAPTDLVWALNTLLGDAYNHTASDVSWVYDYHLGGRGKEVGKAAASTAVGLAAMAVIGFGWYSLPKKVVENVRFTIKEIPPATGFIAMAIERNRVVPLAQAHYRTLNVLSTALTELELRFLLGRCAFGFDPNADYSQIQNRLEQALGGQAAQELLAS